MSLRTQSIVFALMLLAVAAALHVQAQEPVRAQADHLQEQVNDPSLQAISQQRETEVATSKAPRQLDDRVTKIEGQLEALSEAIMAAVNSADRYGEYLTYVAGAVVFIFTIGGAAAGYWITSVLKRVEEARGQVQHVNNELSSTIAIARAVPALLRSNLEEQDPDRKRLHAEEAFRYITQAESMGYTDSHLLNWKAYTLKRMDRLELALEAAQAALKAAKPNDPQRARAFYNIACYHALLDDPKHQEALDALDQAILTNEWYRPVARSDRDFDHIRELPADSKLKQRFDKMVA